MGEVGEREPNHRTGSLFWGLTLIMIGGTALLVQLGYLPADLDDLWPVVVIGLGLWMLVQAAVTASGRGFTAGLVALTAGVYLIVDRMRGLPEGSFFPALLVALGVGILLRPRSPVGAD